MIILNLHRIFLEIMKSMSVIKCTFTLYFH